MKKNTTLITSVSSLFLWPAAILLFSALFLSSCSDDDEGLPPATEDITQIIENTEGLDSLFKILDFRSNGNLVFSDISVELLKSNRTFFAPNNEAFANLVEAVGVSSVLELRTDILRNILNYHIVDSTQFLTVSQLSGNLPTSLDNETISVNAGASPIALNETTQPNRTPTIVMGDQPATNNSILHIVDNILLPSSITDDVSPTFGTLAGYISMVGGLGDMDILVRKAGLRSALADANTEYTVLGIFQGVLNVSDISDENAAIVAGYHIIPGNPFEATISPTEVPTLIENDPIYVYENPNAENPDLSVSLNVSSILISDFWNSSVSNGRIYLPTSVTSSGSLQPTFLTPGAFRNTGYGYVEFYGGTDEGDDLTLLKQAVDMVPSVKAILEGTDRYTFFAPNDDAFAAANISADSLAAMDPTLLGSILMNHFVSGVTFSQQLSGTTKETLEGNSISFAQESQSIVLTYGAQTATIIYSDFLSDVGVIHDVNGLLIPE